MTRFRSSCEVIGLNASPAADVSPLAFPVAVVAAAFPSVVAAAFVSGVASDMIGVPPLIRPLTAGRWRSPTCWLGKIRGLLPSMPALGHGRRQRCDGLLRCTG